MGIYVAEIIIIQCKHTVQNCLLDVFGNFKKRYSFNSLKIDSLIIAWKSTVVTVLRCTPETVLGCSYNLKIKQCYSLVKNHWKLCVNLVCKSEQASENIKTAL